MVPVFSGASASVGGASAGISGMLIVSGDDGW